MKMILVNPRSWYDRKNRRAIGGCRHSLDGKHENYASFRADNYSRLFGLDAVRCFFRTAKLRQRALFRSKAVVRNDGRHLAYLRLCVDASDAAGDFSFGKIFY